MFMLTISMILLLGISRFIAIKRRQVSIKFFRQYLDGKQPERLHILGRHVQNHFEVPPLFYVGVLLSVITNNPSSVSVIAAWLFVIFRCIHSYIHLGKNNVSHRFFCFGASLMALLVLWGSVFVAVLRNAWRAQFSKLRVLSNFERGTKTAIPGRSQLWMVMYVSIE